MKIEEFKHHTATEIIENKQDEHNLKQTQKKFESFLIQKVKAFR